MKKFVEKRFVKLLVDENVFQHNPDEPFTLKSGEKSDYFLNFGNLSLARALMQIGAAYWEKLKPQLDPKRAPRVVLLGPAYKGIPLATATAIAAALDPIEGLEVSVIYTRKEEKDHGEGGTLVGAQSEDWGEVWVVDDVISYATAFREVEKLLEVYNKKLFGFLVGVDRCERRDDTSPTVAEELKQQGRVKRMVSVTTLPEVIEEAALAA